MNSAISTQNVERFSSKEQNESGLIYYLYRYYDPLLQRWISRDPIEEKGGINLHTFSKNEPLSHLDPFGHDNPGCDIGHPSSNGDCYLRCCAVHDFCFDTFGCTKYSWFLIIDPFSRCAGCDRAVACCWAKCVFQLETYPGSIWYCPNGPNRGTWYYNYASIPPDCWADGHKPLTP
jgi:RHS repeat-associated protein